MTTPDTEQMRKWVLNNTVLFLLGCFLLIDVLSLGIVLQTSVETTGGEFVVERTVSGDDTGRKLKLSDIRGPRIDEEAAMVVVDEEASTLPLRLWIFLLIAYAGLLIFNLAYDFERMTNIQWGWEVILTLVALLAWYVWDERGMQPWYPLAVIKTGLLIYAIYLYLFDRKILRRSLEEARVSVE